MLMWVTVFVCVFMCVGEKDIVLRSGRDGQHYFTYVFYLAAADLISPTVCPVLLQMLLFLVWEGNVQLEKNSVSPTCE